MESRGGSIEGQGNIAVLALQHTPITASNSSTILQQDTELGDLSVQIIYGIKEGWRSWSALRLEKLVVARQVVGSNPAPSTSHSPGLWLYSTPTSPPGPVATSYSTGLRPAQPPIFPLGLAGPAGISYVRGFLQKRVFPRAMYLATSWPSSPWARPEYLDMGDSGRKIYIHIYSWNDSSGQQWVDNWLYCWLENLFGQHGATQPLRSLISWLHGTHSFRLNPASHNRGSLILSYFCLITGKFKNTLYK